MLLGVLCVTNPVRIDQNIQNEVLVERSIFVEVVAYQLIIGEQGCRRGESARLPPMWSGLNSRRRRHVG